MIFLNDIRYVCLVQRNVIFRFVRFTDNAGQIFFLIFEFYLASDAH